MVLSDQSPISFQDALPESVDVVVIGAGVAGISTAWFLAKRGVDVLVLPTSPTPAPKIPDARGVTSREDADGRIFGVRNFTGPFNLANVPALAVPCGFTSDNLPISLQIAGRPFEEGTVMRVGHAYERATDWHPRKPPI